MLRDFLYGVLWMTAVIAGAAGIVATLVLPVFIADYFRLGGAGLLLVTIVESLLLGGVFQVIERRLKG